MKTKTDHMHPITTMFTNNPGPELLCYLTFLCVADSPTSATVDIIRSLTRTLMKDRQHDCGYSLDLFSYKERQMHSS